MKSAVISPRQTAMADSWSSAIRLCSMKQEARTQTARLSRKTSASTEKDSYSINSAIVQYNMHRSELSSSLHTAKCKAVLLGDSGVGKSAIIDRFVNTRYDPLSQPTVGIDFLSRNVTYANKPYRLQLWDTAGQEKYKSLVPAYLRDANCGLLVFEIPRKESFDSLKAWLALFREHAPAHAPILLLANKADMLSLEECAFKEEVEVFRKEEGLFCWQTSAKSGLNVEAVFQRMIDQLQAHSRGHQAGGSEEQEEQNQATNFFLKYNRATFDLRRRRKNCCFI